MKLHINIDEDKDLREAIKDSINGVVVSITREILRETIESIIDESLKKEVNKIDKSYINVRLDNIVRDILKESMSHSHPLLDTIAHKIQHEITKQVSDALKFIGINNTNNELIKS